MTELASGAIMQSTPSQSKLSEADETAAIVIVGWPAKATAFHSCRSTRCCRLGCQPRLMLNVIFGIRLAGRFRRAWRCGGQKVSTLGSVVGLPLVIITVVALRGRNLEPRFPVKAACRRAT
jgi:hypothetical protein